MKATKSMRPRTPAEKTFNAKPASYKQGWKDAEALTKMFTLWCATHMVHVMGFRRKGEKTDKKLKRYCDGFNDHLEKIAKDKGVKLVDGLLHSKYIGI